MTEIPKEIEGKTALQQLIEESGYVLIPNGPFVFSQMNEEPITVGFVKGGFQVTLPKGFEGNLAVTKTTVEAFRKPDTPEVNEPITVQEIESAGWKYIQGNYWVWPWVPSNQFPQRDYFFRLCFIPKKDSPLIVDLYDNNYLEWCRAYEGRCSNSEELKTIMDLLHIVQSDKLVPSWENIMKPNRKIY